MRVSKRNRNFCSNCVTTGGTRMRCPCSPHQHSREKLRKGWNPSAEAPGVVALLDWMKADKSAADQDGRVNASCMRVCSAQLQHPCSSKIPVNLENHEIQPEAFWPWTFNLGWDGEPSCSKGTGSAQWQHTCVPRCFTFPKRSHRTLLLGENYKKCFYCSQMENFSFLTQSTQFSWNCWVQVTRVRILQGHPSSASKKQLYKYKNSAWWRSFFLSHHPSKRLIRSIMEHFFTEFYDLSATDISNISISCLWSWKHHLLGS